MPARCAASTTRRVPPTLTSSKRRPPDSRGMATRWTTASAPASASSRPAPVVTSAARASTASVQPGSRRPVREMAITRWPASTRCGTRWLPTNPVPPTIAMFMHLLSALFLLLSRRTFLSATVRPMPSTTAPHGMVVTPHPLATAAGVDALRAGGSAVDAAVAANAMLAVVYCNACGLGGDAFALVWDPGERRLHGFNGSGRSPAGLTIDAVQAAGHAEMPARGPLPITVPGAVDAWVAAARAIRPPLARRRAGTRRPDRRRGLRTDRDQRSSNRSISALVR